MRTYPHGCYNMSRMRIRYISVIIPAYNEENRLPATLKRVHEYLVSKADEFEIVVVDDGSSDTTESEVMRASTEMPGIRLVKNGANMGKGFSVRQGVLASRGELVLISDADLSTPIEEVEKLIPFVEGEFDIAIGSRAMKESELAVRQPWYREGMGRAFNALVRSLVIGGLSDTQCGFKLISKEAAKRIFERCRIDGFSFDVEVLFLAERLGYRIKEVPVKWLNSPASRVRIFRDSTRMFLDLLIIRLNALFGKYS